MSAVESEAGTEVPHTRDPVAKSERKQQDDTAEISARAAHADDTKQLSSSRDADSARKHRHKDWESDRARDKERRRGGDQGDGAAAADGTASEKQHRQDKDRHRDRQRDSDRSRGRHNDRDREGSKEHRRDRGSDRDSGRSRDRHKDRRDEPSRRDRDSGRKRSSAEHSGRDLTDERSSKRARQGSPDLEEGQLPAPPAVARGDVAPMDVDADGGRSPRSHEARRERKRERRKQDKEEKVSAGTGKDSVAAPDMSAGLTADEIAMMQSLGLPFGFQTTQGVHLDDDAANEGGFKVSSQRKPRQYMNRKGGFNRSLPAERTGEKMQQV